MRTVVADPAWTRGGCESRVCRRLFRRLARDLHATQVRFSRTRRPSIAADIGDLVKNDDERLPH